MSTVTDSIGRVLGGRYRIEAILGAGASAYVYAAWDVTLGRRVAVKILHPTLAEDEAFLRRFRAEARAAAALSHPHIVPVFDWGDDGGRSFLVLEYLGGGSLRDLHDRTKLLSVSQAVQVGREAAEGLAYAHDRGIVHRDIKPANLLFGDEGRLRIADFGLARALAEAAWTEPAGAMLGTARYAAPEQVDGRPLDGRADVYALSLVLYEAVTGVTPFVGDTTVSTLMARIGKPLPGHDGLGPLGPILTEAAAPHVEERLDAAALVECLTDLVGQLPPADRLALAGPAMGRPMDPGPTDAMTEMGVWAVPSNRDGSSKADLAAETAATSRSGRKEGRKGERKGKSHRGIWALVVGLVLVVLIAGGLVETGLRKGWFTPSHTVPSLASLDIAQARSHLASDHFLVRVSGSKSSLSVPKGEILNQTPGAKTSLKQGSTVSVVLSSGLPKYQIPNLLAAPANSSCAAATNILTALHLKANCTPQSSTTVPSGQVISWSPKGKALYGSTVNVVVSSGLPTETIPTVTGTGSTCQTATTALESVHLVASCQNEYSTTVTTVGQVITTNPTTSAPYGSTVTVEISEGPPLVTVPTMSTSTTVQQAITDLENAGFQVGSIFGPGGGKVFKTSPNEGTQIPEGSTVNIYTQ